MLLPRQELFLYMYVRKEAVLSSQIEGTQSTLSDLLRFETEAQAGRRVARGKSLRVDRPIILHEWPLLANSGCPKLSAWRSAQGQTPPIIPIP